MIRKLTYVAVRLIALLLALTIFFDAGEELKVAWRMGMWLGVAMNILVLFVAMCIFLYLALSWKD